LQQALVNLALNAHDALRGDRGSRVEDRGSNQEERAPEQVGPSAPGDPRPSILDPRSSIVFRLRQQVLTAARHAFPQNVPPGDYVVLEVADRGCGMNDKVLGQALDPFFTTKEVGKGTGLGLPVVFGIIQAHHGFLTIDTAPGRGTCVALYLPRLADAG